MTAYSFISTILSYVFTVIIYLFIFSVMRLIYMDIKKMNRFANDNINTAETASLRPIKSKVSLSGKIQKRYNIYNEAVVGRNKKCDIVINEQFISSEHLRIWFENDEWYLEDLGSRNGTYVNEQRIRKVVLLDPEDVISIGGLNFVFEL